MQTTIFNHVIQSVENTYQTLECSGAALVIYHHNQLQVEKYWGKQSAEENARTIQRNTKFHIASCRKTYIAYAVHHRFIQSLDEEILNYLPNLKNKEIYKDITIRHLVTHSHGLFEKDGEVIKEFEVGTQWGISWN